MIKYSSHTGVFIAVLVIAAWFTCLVSLLSWHFSWSDPLVYLMILVQMHLYTGLFITAHDAMHGTVSSNRSLNNFTGQLCTAFMPFFLIKSYIRSIISITKTYILSMIPIFMKVALYAGT